MAWSNSKVFSQYVSDKIANTTLMDYDADSFLVALYGNNITPDQTVSAANSAYAVGQWITGTSGTNEIYSAGQWGQGGVALASKTNVVASNLITIDAADTPSGATATLAAVYGCLVYDNTIASPVAKQGMSYHYFGGSNSVTSGVFTVVWSANGIDRYTA